MAIDKALTDKLILLKEEQVKAEAECSKLDQTMQILTKKLKSHQDNIQAMNAELSLKEEETRVFTDSGLSFILYCLLFSSIK